MIQTIDGCQHRPLLLTTKSLYPRYQYLLFSARIPERRGVIVVLPVGPEKTRASLLAIARSYYARGGAVRLIEENRRERYNAVRQRLAGRPLK